MNIFEFLGKPFDYRTEKKIFQLVKHFDDVNPLAEQGIFHKKVSFPMLGQVKRDGVFCAIVVRVDGVVDIFNRTGKRMTNVTMLWKKVVEAKLAAGVYMGELLSTHECSLEQLSGVVNPLRVNPIEYKVEKDGTIVDQPAIAAGLYIDLFDHLSVCGFISGGSDAPYKLRHARLIIRLEGTNFNVLPYYIIRDMEELDAFSEAAINEGEEGAVFKQNVGYLCGAKDWHQMKIVRGIHVDLECIGWEEGTGKYEGKVVNLLFRYKKGKQLKAMLGKGWSHDDAEELYSLIVYNCSSRDALLNRRDSPIGKIYHVYGLQPSSKNGLIRLPKVAELRHDKAEPDY